MNSFSLLFDNSATKSMDTRYHINLVKNTAGGYHRTENDNRLANEAEELYKAVESAMPIAVETGNWKQYCDSIKEYDKFVWEQSHKGNQTNIFANPKIKVGPSWAEQMWAPVFERARLKMEQVWDTTLILIQNNTAVETLGSTGPTSMKDVDNGIGINKIINNKEYIMPIIVAENKGGHYCKTTCTNVDGIFRRVRAMNSNVLAFALTDNHITVGSKVEVDHSFGSGGVLICQRGNNRKSDPYPLLNPDKFELVERMCINYLSTFSTKDFLDILPSQTSGILLRDHIDTKGYYIPPELEEFV
jgi:hypothetical protein